MTRHYLRPEILIVYHFIWMLILQNHKHLD